MGFYAYMPDITVWLRLQPDFPFKQNLLQLDAQTLQLVVFAFLLFVILAKVSLWFVRRLRTSSTLFSCTLPRSSGIAMAISRP